MRHRFKPFLLFFTFVCWLSASFNSNAQELINKSITVTQLSGSAVELLSHIETRADVVFSYSNKVCLPGKVIFTQSKGTIKNFLDLIFATCKVEYRVVGNKIMILPILKTQEKYTLRGFVRDSTNGEVLIAASVFEVNSSLGTYTNDHGFFSLSPNQGEVLIGCSYVGYDTRYVKINLQRDTLINLQLAPMPQLQEVQILGMNIMNSVNRTSISTIEIPISQIQNVPSFLGEVDLIKSVQLFPGVQNTGEGFSGLLVRGGGNDQNLILMDDVPVYNVDHLLGFFSIFNPDAINKVTLIKGGFPAQYGGRLSSVLDIRTYDGNQEKLNGSVSLGLLSSKIFINGPIFNENNRFSFSYRRTYYDLLTAPYQFDNDEKLFYYFNDLNGKYVHSFKNNSSLSLSFYSGQDDLLSRYNYKEVTRSLVSSQDEDLTLNDEAGSSWGNIVASLDYKFILTKRIFGNLTFAYSNYQFVSKTIQSYYDDTNWSSLERKYLSGITDYNFKADFDYLPANGHRIKWGATATNHSFYPGIDMASVNVESSAKVDTALGGSKLSGHEYHAYLQDDFNVSSLLRLNVGCHFSTYDTGSKSYYSVEPRISSRLYLMPDVALKMAYAVTSQYVHVLSTSNVSLPTDLWLPVTDDIKPMKAWQLSLGSEWAIRDGFSLSLEGYYKATSNLLDYKENQSFFDYSTTWGDKLTSGSSESYGLEVLLHRKIGKLSGWIGYTLSRSISQFDELNNGKAFRSNSDRLHDGTLFLSYVFGKRVDASLTWSYTSGAPVTLTTEKYYAPDVLSTSLTGSYSEYYSNRNSYSMPDFHRLDIGFNFYKKIKQGDRIWSLGIMNVYGRQNPFFLYYADSAPDENGNVSRQLMQYSLFAFPFPYVRYTVKF